MREFEYAVAGDARAAIAAARGGARYLAGGTNLVDLMKLGVETPALVVDVSRLPFDSIEPTADGGLLIGAMASNSDVAAHPVVRQRYPVLARALLSGASGQLRNAATVGGNLLQRTRCGYFQDVTKPCNKRAPGSGCPARDGDHRNHAILGASKQCIATNPSDLAVALAALDAVVVIEDDAGPRRIPLSEFYRRPGERPDLETNLPPGALITGVELPALGVAARSTYRKVRDRASYAFAVISVAAALEVREGIVDDVRIALGGVAPLPWRARRAEAALARVPATEESFRVAAVLELDAAEPLRDNAFKVPLARNLITRVLLDLATASGATA
ncbi:MAG: molybdopterin dehydrogenase [Pseudonocardiales bacterium]|nr:MAG: molybdopterin dehydrogenase [Pseudonocardiales bacterium]